MGYCIAQTSLAHTYGNVACFITDYVKSLFAENYFSSIHISSTVAYKQFSVFQNSKKEFLMKNRPTLIIRPRIEFNDSDTFLYDTFLTTRITDNYMERCFTNLQDFIYDKENGAYVKFLLNRLKMLFDVTIITDTQIDQLNQAHYIRNRVRQEKPFFLETCLESYVPKQLMRVLAESIGMSLYDQNGSIKPFLDYANSVSIYPISYKIKNASGNDEFFRFYPAKIDTTISGLSIDDGNKRGMITDTYTVSFTISTEFYSSGLYYLFNKSPNNIDKIIMDMRAEPENKIIPLFTIDNNNIERIADGWIVYASYMYNVDKQGDDDYMDISSVFNYSLKKIIEYHLQHGIPLKTFLIPQVIKDGRYLVEGKNFKIDYEKGELITYKGNMSSTYRLIFHVNTLYVNTMLKDILDLEKEK